jgi:hypothetical protein
VYFVLFVVYKNSGIMATFYETINFQLSDETTLRKGETPDMEKKLALNLMHRFCIGDIFRRVALNKPDKTALVYLYKGEKKGEITYGELNEKANRLANALLDLGYPKGRPGGDHLL